MQPKRNLGCLKSMVFHFFFIKKEKRKKKKLANLANLPVIQWEWYMQGLGKRNYFFKINKKIPNCIKPICSCKIHEVIHAAVFVVSDTVRDLLKKLDNKFEIVYP